MNEQLSLGIDIGGTKTAVGLLKGGRLEQRAEAPTPAADLPRLLDTIARLTAPLIGEAATIGACAPGYLDPRSGLIGHASNLPALAGAGLADLLAGRLGRQVSCANDADAAALAEFRLGAACEAESAFYVTVSTGIGGGFVSQGGLLRGHAGAAAEVGHLCVEADGAECACGGRGCLETLASGTAIAARAGFELGRPVDAAEVFRNWREGDEVSDRVVRTAARALARGLAAVAQLLDPELIVVGGSVALHNGDFIELVRQDLRAELHSRPVPGLVSAALGGDAGIIGAALLPLEAA